MPGGTRQSILSHAREGITLIFSDAWIMVGVSVTPSIGSMKISRSGARLPIDSSAAAGCEGSSPSARSSAAGPSVSANENSALASFASTGDNLSSALSPVWATTHVRPRLVP